jgi:sterol desaturase/sphingolipid hydroxylase (fatty acid hydroxylase superfamily)
MLMVLFTLILVFIIVSLFGYVVHRSLHQSWTGRFNKSHMAHHLVLYPPSDYFSETYRHAGKDNTFITFAFASLPLLAFPWVLYGLGAISLPLAILIVAEMLLIGFLHDYIHMAFHVPSNWLNRFKAVQRWNKLHFQHHVEMQTNFGIFTFFFDKLFGTYNKN